MVPEKYKANRDKPGTANPRGGIREKRVNHTGNTDANEAERAGDRQRPASDAQVRRTSDETVVNREENNTDGNSTAQGGRSEEEEAIIVEWYGPDDPENPKNW